MSTEKIKKLEDAYEWGKDAIQEYKSNGIKVPAWIWERQLEIADRIIKTLSEEV